MSTGTRIPPTEEVADQRAVLDDAFPGKPLDPEAAKRAHERAEAVRKKFPETLPFEVAHALTRAERIGRLAPVARR